MSNKPYLTREKIDTLLKQGIKKRDFEDQNGEPFSFMRALIGNTPKRIMMKLIGRN